METTCSMPQCIEPQKEVPLVFEMNRLSRNTILIEERLIKLKQRLDPFMTPVKPEPSCEPVNKTACHCEFIVSLKGQSARIEQISLNLVDILERLEI